MKILNFVNLVPVENCIQPYAYLATGRHNHQTRSGMKDYLILPSCNTSKFDTKAFLH